MPRHNGDLTLVKLLENKLELLEKINQISNKQIAQLNYWLDEKIWECQEWRNINKELRAENNELKTELCYTKE